MTRTAALILALLAAAPAFADTQTDTAAVQNTQNADSEALHNELRALRDTMQQALNQRDLDTLLAHVADDVVFTTMNGDRVHGKDGIRAYYDKMLGGANPVVQSIEAEFKVEQLSHLYHGNTAVAFGSSSDRYRLTGGETWTVEPKWSATLVRQDGRWLIADFHYSVNMFDNPVLAAQRKLLLGGGAAAVLAAAAAGFLIGRRGRKKAV
ncbi:SgcJ/EcaC family oxidoreductase [Neisseria sp. WLZKY-1]|uniref:SgcJ/EcaC family oxidoreductase n=1 Tax=Neisseria sp. WLZKY-1 TaxID=3390377 RepID=UPI00397C67C6